MFAFGLQALSTDCALYALYITGTIYTDRRCNAQQPQAVHRPSFTFENFLVFGGCFKPAIHQLKTNPAKSQIDQWDSARKSPKINSTEVEPIGRLESSNLQIAPNSSKYLRRPATIRTRISGLSISIVRIGPLCQFVWQTMNNERADGSS